MLDPSALFNWSPYVDAADRARQAGDHPTLLVTMGSFTDAGATRKLVEERLLDGFANHRLGTFDIDQLFDYAGHRPQIVFERDHFKHYEAPEIALHEVTDGHGTRFLLLSGPEPALQWERMAAAVNHLIDVFDVGRVVFLQAMPAPAPHTRPVYVSGFASDPALLGDRDGMPGTFQMSASFGSLLTVRLGEQGHEVVGLVAHVPYYLAEGEYPDAAIALLNQVGSVSGLELPSGGRLAQASAASRGLVDAQVAQSEEVQSVIHRLESQYEQFMSQRALAAKANVPSADEIGAEVEEFLKGLDDKPGKGNQPGEENPPDEGGQPV